MSCCLKHGIFSLYKISMYKTPPRITATHGGQNEYEMNCMTASEAKNVTSTHITIFNITYNALIFFSFVFILVTALPPDTTPYMPRNSSLQMKL